MIKKLWRTLRDRWVLRSSGKDWEITKLRQNLGAAEDRIRLAENNLGRFVTIWRLGVKPCVSCPEPPFIQRELLQTPTESGKNQYLYRVKCNNCGGVGEDAFTASGAAHIWNAGVLIKRPSLEDE